MAKSKPYYNMFELALPSNKVTISDSVFTLINWGRIMPSTWKNIPHSHSYYEACYCFKGQGYYTNVGNRVHVDENQWCLACPGEVHQMCSSESSSWGVFCMCFAMLPNTTGASKQGKSLVDNLLNTDQRVIPGETKTHDLCEKLSLEVTMQQPGYEQAVSGYFSILLIDMLRSLKGTIREGTPPFARYGKSEEIRVQQAIRYIEENLSNPLSIGEVAENVFISQRQLSRIFHKVLSASPLQVINQIRLNAATQMLSGTTLSIKEIAGHCGFNNERYFMSTFRKHTGMTAGYFRKNSLRLLPNNYLPNKHKLP